MILQFRDKEVHNGGINKTLCRNPLVKIGRISLNEIQDFSIGQRFIVTIGTKYSSVDQVRFVEDSL